MSSGGCLEDIEGGCISLSSSPEHQTAWTIEHWGAYFVICIRHEITNESPGVVRMYIYIEDCCGLVGLQRTRFVAHALQLLLSAGLPSDGNPELNPLRRVVVGIARSLTDVTVLCCVGSGM